MIQIQIAAIALRGAASAMARAGTFSRRDRSRVHRRDARNAMAAWLKLNHTATERKGLMQGRPNGYHIMDLISPCLICYYFVEGRTNHCTVPYSTPLASMGKLLPATRSDGNASGTQPGAFSVSSRKG